jgi:hypothetical protein
LSLLTFSSLRSHPLSEWSRSFDCQHCPLLICHTFGSSHRSLSTHTLRPHVRLVSSRAFHPHTAHHFQSHVPTLPRTPPTLTPNTTITPCRCAHCGGSIVRCRHTIVYGGRRHELSVVHRRVYIDGVLCHHARSVSFDPHRCLQAVVDPPPPPPTLVHRCVHIDGVLYYFACSVRRFSTFVNTTLV